MSQYDNLTKKSRNHSPPMNILVAIKLQLHKFASYYIPFIHFLCDQHNITC